MPIQGLAITKNQAPPTAGSYGMARVYLEECIVGVGAGAPAVPGATAIAGTTPPGSIEISAITRSSQGVYVVTLSDVYYARVYAAADIDDTANSGMYATIGNWSNLGCLGTVNGPTSFTLYARAAAGTLTDIPNGVSAFIALALKKDFTGAAA